MKRVLLFLACLPLVASALTQSEVEQAVYAALTSAPLNFSGGQINVIDWLYPSLSSPTLGEYLQYNIGGAFSYQPPDGTMSANLVRARKALESISSVTNDLGIIRTDLADFASEFSGWHTSWSTYSSAVDQHLQRITTMVGDLRSAAQSIDSYQQSLTNLVAGLKDDFSDMAHDLDTDLGQLVGDAQLTVNNLTQIAMDLSESANYLSSIQQGVWDTAGAAGGILDYLEANLAQMFLSLDTGLLNVSVSITNALGDLPIPDLSNGVGITNWPSTLTNSGWWDDMRSEAFKRNDILGRTHDAVTNIADSVSNLVVTLTPSSEQLSYVASITNSIATNSAAVATEYETDVDTYTNEAEGVTSGWFDDLDFFTANPYDDGDTVIDNFQEAVSALVDDVDPATTSDVILMGSVGRTRSASGVWGSMVAKLPRIEFNMENLFERWRRLATIKNIFRALWLIVGVFYRLILLSVFLTWFARYDKR